ncbi:mediator of RNA polymerase II transcription subunit 6-like [Corticium candelabrum]|uniref:mediator of RNA polymerase II transcription subunit 6-like n=1 Tax=Corticium candelabrum TaxID=121492 RepID=UPI002E258047|nr:mediator of RNA polymerase II transcription subunit 6-like [Corticium candelabrum]
MADQDRSQLTLSWQDSAWLPHLNSSTALDYFSQESNPFYDHTCNNELIKMQRLDPSQLTTMTGIEYALVHSQDPILYVIRKQRRLSQHQAVTPLADYYILAGTVYQAPDLCSVINSRLLSALHHLQFAFDECRSKATYDPKRGYGWTFQCEGKKKESDVAKDEEQQQKVSVFQRHRVDMLLGKLAHSYPSRVVTGQPGEKPVPTVGKGEASQRNVNEDEVTAANDKQPQQQSGQAFVDQTQKNALDDARIPPAKKKRL